MRRKGEDHNWKIRIWSLYKGWWFEWWSHFRRHYLFVLHRTPFPTVNICFLWMNNCWKATKLDASLFRISLLEYFNLFTDNFYKPRELSNIIRVSGCGYSKVNIWIRWSDHVVKTNFFSIYIDMLAKRHLVSYSFNIFRHQYKLWIWI